MSNGVALYLASILSAYAILGLIVYVPGLMSGASTLLTVGIVIVVIVVLLFATATILKGLSKLLESLKS